MLRVKDLIFLSTTRQLFPGKRQRTAAFGQTEVSTASCAARRRRLLLLVVVENENYYWYSVQRATNESQETRAARYTP